MNRKVGDVLTDPLVRALLGDGPANLFQAASEVFAVLQAGGGALPPAPSLIDALSPLRIPSIVGGWGENRVLAELDQDGFAFARHPLDEPVFNRRAEKRPRQQNLIDVVLLDGRICIRKRFRGLRPGAVRWGSQKVPSRDRVARRVWSTLRLFLCSEAAALLRLRDLPFVPKVRHIDLADHALYIDCIDGESLRHLAARSGEAVHDKDLAGEADLRGLTGSELDRREVDLLDRTGIGDFRSEIAAMSAQINERGVAPLDIKLGNFVRGAATGRLHWLDFEISRLRSQPRWDQDLAAQHQLLQHLFQLDQHLVRPQETKTA